uniref:TIR domain-containing protein n=1 Tax=Anopheles christyi TaxID=43041 RepID=A0A182KG40_9DIPT
LLQITQAVEDSRRTIIVLSRNYLESVWGQMEFNSAYLQSVEDKRNRVIPIIYDDIGNIDELEPELRAYLKIHTYLRWDDARFWDKLHHAMPHKRRLKHLKQTAVEMRSQTNKRGKPLSHSMVSAWVCCLSLLILLTAQASTSRNCSVSKQSSIQTQLKCPGFNVQLTLHTGRRQLEVQCSAKPDFELLRNHPNLPTMTFQELAYRDCPLPVGNLSLVEHLSTILDRSQLSAISRLFFVDNAILSEQVALDPQLFAGLGQLKVLSMKNSTRMPLDNSRLFEHLPNITWLDLRQGDGGSRVARALLRPLTQLTTLELMENELTTLPTELVSELPSLESLTLYQNKLERIERFTELPKLTSLDLTYNQLVTLQEDVLDRLPNLSQLMLRSNKLASLPSGLLRMNTKLTAFLADKQLGAGLELGDGLFARLTMLQNVSLSSCKISTLPESLFTGANQITIVNLSDNRLQSLPENLLRDLSNLKELYLQHNELINMLPDTLLHGAPQLRILNLGYNNLTTLSEQLLESQTSLEKLHLEYNQLHTIEWEAFNSQSKSLQLLNLSHNRLAMHEDGRDVVYQNGKTIYVSQTPFYNLNNVEVLDLSYNAIIRIFMDFIKYMENLISVDLSHNQIKNISYANFQFYSPNFKWLNLSSNLIAYPNFGHVDSPPRLPREIILDNNPLNCDCWSYPLLTFLQTQAKADFPLKGLQCAQPLTLRGKKPQHVPLEELVCEIDASSGFCPTECNCYKRAIDRGVIVNCTAANLAHVPIIQNASKINCDFRNVSKIDCNSIELHLDQNMLHDLTNVGEGWNQIRRLYIANNSLATL